MVNIGSESKIERPADTPCEPETFQPSQDTPVGSFFGLVSANVPRGNLVPFGVIDVMKRSGLVELKNFGVPKGA